MLMLLLQFAVLALIIHSAINTIAKRLKHRESH
jgi:hypothetical protein